MRYEGSFITVGFGRVETRQTERKETQTQLNNFRVIK
jgi:hypothetical protein